MGGCQEGSMILAPSRSAAGVTVVGPAVATRRKMAMSAIMEAVVAGVLYLTHPPYPHPVVSCPGKTRLGVECEGVGKEEDDSMSSRGVRKAGNSTIPMLPPELYSVIAYHLHTTSSTPETLFHSCPLVSSAWLIASRMYAFRTVRLTYANVYGFLRLLEDPRCSFKCCIRRLELREGEYALDRWMSDVLPRLVLERRMRRVEILDVYNLTWTELSPLAVRALTEGFAPAGKEEEGEMTTTTTTTTIKSLKVGTCYWECMHDFVGFVCSPSFAQLKTLVCDSVLLNCGMGSCRCRDVGEELADTAVVRESAINASRERDLPGISPVLECLYLGLPEEQMLKWFIKEDTVCRVAKLGLTVRENPLMQLVGHLVGRATNVEELALDLPSGCDLSLVNNTRLKSLRVTINLCLLSSSPLSIPLSTNPYADNLTRLLDLISSISSSDIRLLTINLDLTLFSVWEFCSLWPWKDFVKVVNGLKNMKRVVFIVTYCRRRAFMALKDVIKKKTRMGTDRIDCKVKVRGVRSAFLSSTQDSRVEVWRSWMED